MGAQMLKEVAAKTSDIAGDGTTTATVLAQAIFREGLKNVTAGANPMGLKRGIEQAVEAVVEELKHLSKATKDKKRSEEHTSELQSLAYLVCRLLLEKKKKKQKTTNVR